MTGVIKARDAIATRNVRTLTPAFRLAAGAAPIADAVSAELAALRLQLESLSRRLSQRDADIERLEEEISLAFQEGRLEGVQAGRAEADEGREARLDALDAGIAGAVELYSHEISSLERLSLAVALEGLQKILGDTGRYAELLRDVIRAQVRNIELQSVVRIEVSRADFPEPDQLAKLKAAIDRPELELRVRDDLMSGDCRIQLLLGALEIGIDQQWGKLSATLEALAEPRAFQ